MEGRASASANAVISARKGRPQGGAGLRPG